MKKQFTLTGIGFALALIAVLATTPGSGTQYRFNIQRFDFAGETDEAIASVRLFSSIMAELYMTAGGREGLNAFPADREIKRRVFIDINNYNANGTVFVPDRDKTEFQSVVFLSPVHAIVVTHENWFTEFQRAGTRKPISNKKINELAIRYYVKKMWGKWIVLDYEVYSRKDTIPPIASERFLKW